MIRMCGYSALRMAMVMAWNAGEEHVGPSNVEGEKKGEKEEEVVR